jgi:hypothetical protein
MYGALANDMNLGCRWGPGVARRQSMQTVLKCWRFAGVCHSLELRVRIAQSQSVRRLLLVLGFYGGLEMLREHEGTELIPTCHRSRMCIDGRVQLRNVSCV